jgi:DNA-binding transcriptional MerR regulator
MNDVNLVQEDVRAPRYRSSAAARMVNIPVATLRVWERRYQVVGPVQSASGQRLYSSQDVRRLVLIKQLVNRGHAIGMLARMETPQLQDLLDEAREVDISLQPQSGHGGNARAALSQASATVASSTAAVRGGAGTAAAHVSRVVLVGQGASLRWTSALQGLQEFDLTAQVDASPGSELALRQVNADLLLADLGAIHMETVDWLVRVQQMVGARQMVVVYGFANTQVLDALRVRGALLKRAPLSPEDLLQGLRETVRGWHSVSLALRQLPDPAPAPRIDPARLDQLIAAMPRVACECPRHLADLVTMLGQFEAYSADCETRQPADVALHAYLYRVAGHARAMMEEALLTLARAEGILPMDAQRA